MSLLSLHCTPKKNLCPFKAFNLHWRGRIGGGGVSTYSLFFLSIFEKSKGKEGGTCENIVKSLWNLLHIFEKEKIKWVMFEDGVKSFTWHAIN